MLLVATMDDALRAAKRRAGFVDPFLVNNEALIDLRSVEQISWQYTNQGSWTNLSVDQLQDQAEWEGPEPEYIVDDNEWREWYKNKCNEWYVTLHLPSGETTLTLNTYSLNALVIRWRHVRG